jgi:hypothetical protein
MVVKPEHPLRVGGNSPLPLSGGWESSPAEVAWRPDFDLTQAKVR